jgi:glycosyltransferase involved in cell wall biosynthesis
MLEHGARVGSQQIADKLAAQGHEVVYVTSQASVLTLLAPGHRRKFGYTRRDRRVADRLLEVTPMNAAPLRLLKRLEGTPADALLMALNRRVEGTRSRVLEDGTFDLCIFTAAATMTLVRKVRARHFVYRTNDVLRGFPGAPRSLLRFEDDLLRDFPITAACPVNAEIGDDLRRRSPRLRISVVPNGIDTESFAAAPDPVLAATRERNVIYAGAFNVWVDVELLLATAALMPDRLFHLYGRWEVPAPTRLPPNVAVHGPLPHDAVAAKLKGCVVGVIPYARRNAGRMVERPLKYYEYLAAGLGVAATSHAGRGLAPYAAVGDTPAALASAIDAAPAVAAAHRAGAEAELRRLDWNDIAREIVACCNE